MYSSDKFTLLSVSCLVSKTSWIGIKLDGFGVKLYQKENSHFRGKTNERKKHLKSQKL